MLRVETKPLLLSGKLWPRLYSQRFRAVSTCCADCLTRVLVDSRWFPSLGRIFAASKGIRDQREPPVAFRRRLGLHR